MGVDIQGSVEVQRSYDGRPVGERGTGWEWNGVLQIDAIVDRSYPMFGSLFGYGDGYGFASLAADRGVPEDASDAYWHWHEIFGGTHTTWILFSEIAAVDWNEEGIGYLDESTLQAVSGPGPGHRKQRRGDYLSSGWTLLLDLMKRLARDYGPEHVRLLVEFDTNW